MKVGILQCDEVMEKLQPRFGTYRDMIVRMFAEVLEPMSFDVFDCRKQEYPEDISGYDFFVTTGSKSSAYDQEPWIVRLIDFIRELNRQRAKLIGICFGHQLIALALGGNVEKSPKGWGIGVAENRIIASPAWMQENPGRLNILASHQDQVTLVPEDVDIIAESDFCPYFVVQWNDHFLSVQGHPEWPKGYSEALMIARRGTLIPVERVEIGLESLQLDIDSQIFVRWVMNFVLGK